MKKWQLFNEVNTIGQKWLFCHTAGIEHNNRLWGIVPVLTDIAGMYLSIQDWEMLNINIASFNLSQLLIKPGLAHLSHTPSLAEYASWQGLCVLNTHFPPTIKSLYQDKTYYFKSPFDGARMQMGESMVVDAIKQLQPDICLSLDSNWHLEGASGLFVPSNVSAEQMPMTSGIVFQFDPIDVFKTQLDELMQHQKARPDLVHYVMGDFDMHQVLLLLISGADLVETSRLAQDAIDGILYTQSGSINLIDSHYETDFQPVDDDCPCHTCKNFTRAYMHHLHKQTPLLSKRLQIVHNLHYTRCMTEKLLAHCEHGKLREFINNYMI